MAKVRVTKKGDKGKPEGKVDDKKGGNEAPPARKGAAKASEEYKFTIADLANELGIKAASARIKLRNLDIPKAGRAYGWNNKGDFDKLVKQLKSKE